MTSLLLFGLFLIIKFYKKNKSTGLFSVTMSQKSGKKLGETGKGKVITRSSYVTQSTSPSENLRRLCCV